MPIKPDIPFVIKYIGPESASNRVWVMAVTHGIEQAPVLSLQWAADTLKPQNTRLALVMGDPTGQAEETYGFLTLDGQEMGDDPWSGRDPWGNPYLRRSFDENSAWGQAVPLNERHRWLRQALDDFSPTFVYSMHETVSTFSDYFWGGAGILLIETYATSASDWNLFPGAITGLEALKTILKNPLQYLSEMTGDWLDGVFRIPRYRRLQRSLSKNPHYQLISRIVERYKKFGLKTVRFPWQCYLSAWHKTTMVGRGRFNTGLEIGMHDWLTLTDYCVNKFGATAVTTETFKPIRVGTWGIDERAEQNFLMLQAITETLDDET